MAGMTMTRILLPVLLTIFATSHHAYGSPIRIDIVPNRVKEFGPAEVKVSCSLNEKEMGSLETMVLGIGKKDEKPMAFIHQKSVITRNLGKRRNVKVSGRIGAKARDSFIKLVISNPTMADAGTYECFIYVKTEKGALKDYRSHARLTVDKEGTRPMIDEISNLKASVKNHEVTIRKQATTILQLKHQLEEQKSSLTIHSDNRKSKDQEMKDFLTNLKDEISSLHTLVEKHEATINDQKSIILEMKNQLQDDNSILSNQSRQIKNIVERASFKSSFSAGYRAEDTLKLDEAIVFSDVITKEGPGYDEKTGLFTAPIEGLYAFHLVLASDQPGELIGVVIKANTQVLAHLFMNVKVVNGHSSMSTVTSLKEGDVVKAEVVNMSENFELDPELSVFSGYLIKTL